MDKEMEGRIPPHSMDAERSVLGAALLSSDALFDVLEVVTDKDFYDKNHREIFQAIGDLSRKNVPVDALTVSEELSRRGTLEAVGGRAYIGSLSSGTPTTANAAEYAKIVAEKASVRRLITMADDVLVKGYEGSMDPGALLDHTEQEIFKISQERQRGPYTHIKDVLLNNIESIDKAAQLEGGLTGLTTGFKELDEMTSGLQKSDLIILAARPAMGKTAFALTLALNSAIRGKGSVIVFNLEMSKEQLGQRILAIESRVDMQNIKKGTLQRSDWDDINDALGVLTKTNIHIDDTGGISITEMKSKCRRLKAEAGLDLVIIDYLQLMVSEGKSESRTQEVSALSRNLKLMARELDCPVLVLSQLSRGPEQRTDHRPMLSDLRESGSIEQDADLVLFLYRDEYYHEEAIPGDCEVIVAKHRSGPTGTIHVAWLSKITKFVDSAGNIPGI